MVDPHCNLCNSNVSSQQKNAIDEEKYFGLKPKCDVSEEKLLQGLPRKIRKLLNNNPSCGKQQKLSQLNNCRELQFRILQVDPNNGSPSSFYTQGMLPCHGPHPIRVSLIL